CSWSYLLYSFVTESCSSGNWLALSSNVEFLLRTFQTLALIEILHACLRLVKSSPVLTAVQLMSRVFVVWGIMLPLGELIYMYTAVVFLWKNGLYRFPMPNSFNVSFDYSWIIVLVMLSYIPGKSSY
ncbi:hypothetical protein T265_14247, partial [Opisthorchis viverrini]